MNLFYSKSLYFIIFLILLGILLFYSNVLTDNVSKVVSFIEKDNRIIGARLEITLKGNQSYDSFDIPISLFDGVYDWDDDRKGLLVELIINNQTDNPFLIKKLSIRNKKNSSFQSIVLYQKKDNHLFSFRIPLKYVQNDYYLQFDFA